MGLVASALKWLTAFGIMLAAGAAAQRYQPAEHTQGPPFFGNITPDQAAILSDMGLTSERDRDPAWTLSEHRRLDRTLAAVQPQRKGVVDAYVVAVALDSVRTAGVDPAGAIFAATAADVTHVVVDGHTIVADGRHTGFDVPAALREALA